MNSILHICLIDAGVNLTAFNMNHQNEAYYVSSDGSIKKEYKDTFDNEHGTICYNYIVAGLETLKFTSIRLLNGELLASVDQLLEAILFVSDLKPDILHLSIGTHNIYDEIRIKPLIKELCERGIVVVSPYSNEYSYTYPASDSNVYGIRFNENIRYGHIEVVNKIYGIEYHVNFEKLYSESSNCYEAAKFTNYLCKKQWRKSKKTVKYKLSNNCFCYPLDAIKLDSKKPFLLLLKDTQNITNFDKLILNLISDLYRYKINAIVLGEVSNHLKNNLNLKIAENSIINENVITSLRQIDFLDLLLLTPNSSFCSNLEESLEDIYDLIVFRFDSQRVIEFCHCSSNKKVKIQTEDFEQHTILSTIIVSLF